MIDAMNGMEARQANLPGMPEERKKRKRDMFLTRAITKYMHGRDEDGTPRMKILAQELFSIARYADTPSARVAAINLILERVDGKVVERKEVKSMRVEGIVHIPSPEGDGSYRIIGASGETDAGGMELFKAPAEGAE